MKRSPFTIFMICFLFMVFNFLNFNANATVHFTESFTSPNFPVSSWTSGSFVLSSGTWDVKNVQGLENLNAYNLSGGAVKLNRYLEAYLSSPAINSVGTVSFYFRNFSSIIGGGEFIVQKSVNNGPFSDIATINFTNISTYTYYSVAINDAGSDVVIRLYCPNTNTGFLCIDEIQISDVGQTLSANPSSLSNLNYFYGAGPSVAQSFNLSGNNLTGAPGVITVTASTNFEVSTDNMNFYASTDIPYSGSLLSPTPLYVRLQSGLEVNTYSGTISVSGGGAVSFGVSCSGNVSIAPPSVINVSPSALSGFNYVFGSGPSGIQSYTISGTDLTGYPGNLSITAPVPYELSLDYSTFTESLSIPYTGTVLPSVVVYVRLKAGLASGAYNSQLIINSGGGANSKNVTCNGSVSAPPSPVLSVTPSTLSGFNYIEGSGPSEVQSYILNGSSLTGFPSDITITAQADYEISLNSASGFASSLSVTYTSATLPPTPIFVRLRSGLTSGAYISETITNSGGGASTVSLSCNGSVSSIPPATLYATPATLQDFTYISGYGPSPVQSYELSGSYLTVYPTDITVTAPADYEISLISGSGYSSELLIPCPDADLTATTIYVRLKAGLTVNSYNSEIITNAGGGAPTVNISCNGYVSAVPPAVLSVNTGTLSGFTYIFGSGPSAVQSYNLSGANLTGYPSDITVSAPTDYEISLSSASEYTSDISVPYTSATLSSTTIYVRLKAGLSIGTYNSEIIANTGGGATTVNVSCGGSVTAVPPPALSLSQTSLNGFSYTLGSGPSAYLSYNLTGNNLTGYPSDIMVTAPADYEISLNSASGYTSDISVPYTSATLSSTTIYVRLKAGLSAGTYNAEIITNTGGGATTLNVSCNGTVTDIVTGPCLSEDFSGFTDGTHATPGSTDISVTLNSYTQEPGWSGLKVFSAGGEIKLGSSSAAGYIITPTLVLSEGASVSFDIQIYGTDAGKVQIFHAPDGVNFVQVGSDITPTTAYTNNSVEITGGTSLSKIKIGTTQKRVYLDNIDVVCGAPDPDPVLSVNTSTLSGFTYIYGHGPSEEQSFNISGTDMDGSDVTITAPADFEISLNSGAGFAGNPIVLSSFDGTSTPVYVRLKAGLESGIYGSETATVSGGGAADIYVNCSGSISEVMQPVLIADPISLTGFTYVYESGPSEEQSFNISGTDMDGSDVTITAPADFEISLNSGTGFTDSDIVLSSFDGTSTPVYIRLKAGMEVGFYDSEHTTVSGGGATDIYVNCSGNVTEDNVYIDQSENNISVSVFPNPAVNQISISNIPGNTEKIRVMDIKGSLVYSVAVNNKDNMVIDISAIGNGTYFIQLVYEQNKSPFYKIIKTQ